MSTGERSRLAIIVVEIVSEGGLGRNSLLVWLEILRLVLSALSRDLVIVKDATVSLVNVVDPGPVCVLILVACRCRVDNALLCQTLALLFHLGKELGCCLLFVNQTPLNGLGYITFE